MKRLTKSQYEVVAGEINWHYHNGSTQEQKRILESLAKGYADIFSDYDSQFDRNLFLDRCGQIDRVKIS